MDRSVFLIAITITITITNQNSQITVLFLHHVSVCVTDLAKAKHFYGSVLALRELPRPDLGFPGAWYAVGTSQELHLIVHPAAKSLRGTRDIDGRDGHLAFRVADYD